MKTTLTILLCLAPTLVWAERFLCFESKTIGTVTYDAVSTRVEGDCLNLGLCTGPNNTGLPANCFEAQGNEWRKSADTFVRVEIGRAHV